MTEKFHGKYGDSCCICFREYKPKLWKMSANTGGPGNRLTRIARKTERRVNTLFPQLMEVSGGDRGTERPQSAVKDVEPIDAEMFLTQAVELFRRMKPFNDYLNKALNGFQTPIR